jgi:hypothetical protein
VKIISRQSAAILAIDIHPPANIFKWAFDVLGEDLVAKLVLVFSALALKKIRILT